MSGNRVRKFVYFFFWEIVSPYPLIPYHTVTSTGLQFTSIFFYLFLSFYAKCGNPIHCAITTEPSINNVVFSKCVAFSTYLPSPPPVRATVGEVRYSIEIDVGGE